MLLSSVLNSEIACAIAIANPALKMELFSPKEKKCICNSTLKKFFIEILIDYLYFNVTLKLAQIFSLKIIKSYSSANVTA